LKYILGGGITGLIFAYYNSEYTIITEDIGGQMSSQFTLGPRYLHKTVNSRYFLSSLKINYVERTARVGYVDDSGWVESPDDNFRKKYFMKSRNTNSLEGFDPTVMNSNKNVFTVLDVNFNELIEKLMSVCSRIMVGRVISIDNENKTLEVDDGTIKTIDYNHIISSIPLNVFSKLLKDDNSIKNEVYEAFSMTYCLVEKELFDVKNFDFIYDVRESTKWHRITKDTKGLVLDFFGNIENKDLISFTGDSYKDHRTLWNCQIVSKNKEPHMKNIKFVGRYGTWNRSWKTERVIDEALALQDKKHT